MFKHTRCDRIVVAGALFTAGLFGCNAAPSSSDPLTDETEVEAAAADPEVDAVDPATESVAAEAEEPVAPKVIPAAFVAAQEEQVRKEVAAQDGTPDTTALELAYFNTQEFKREFARSFLSRTDVEPPVTPDEIEDLKEIIETYTEGDKERAMSKLERANRRLPSANFEFLMAQLYFEREEYARAIELFDSAIERHPTFLRAVQGRARAQFTLASKASENESLSEEEMAEARAKHMKLAGDGFREQLALGGIDGQTYGLLGITLAEQQRFLEAETAFRNALLFQPEKSQWRTGLVTALLRQRRYTDATALLDAMIAESPNEAELWKLQGNAYVGLQDVQRATENFAVVQRLGGADAPTLSLLADLYTNQGLGDVAAETYVAAVRAGAELEAGRGALRGAKQLMRLGQLEAAKSILEGIESEASDRLSQEASAELRKTRSQIAVREGDVEGEIEILRQTVDENPLDGEAMVLLAVALAKSEDVAQAIQLFETAANLDGSAALAKLEHARLLVRQSDFQGAIPLIKASLQIDDSEAVRNYLDQVEKAAARSGGR